MPDHDAAPPDEHVPTRDGYDRWSAIYDAEVNPLVILDDRVTPALLGDVRGLDAADVGCGTGRHALRLAAGGARVTALDFSRGMLDAARAKPGADTVRWIEHDLARPLPLADAAFDRVLCALVFDHVTDVPGLMRELARICRRPRPDDTRPPGVVVSVMHPAMNRLGVQARFTDPLSARRVLPASVHNSVETYVTGARAAGLRIDHLEEHPIDDDLIARAPRAAKHGVGSPLLLTLRLLPDFSPRTGRGAPPRGQAPHVNPASSRPSDRA